MGNRPTISRTLKTTCATIGCVALLGAGWLMATSTSATAQGFQWPWQTQTRPVPREPVYRNPPPRPADQPFPPNGPDGTGGPDAAWNGRSSICLALERRLVQEGQSGSTSRQQLPLIREEIRKVDQKMHAAQSKLDRRGCYEYFLFSKSLRRTRKCIALAKNMESARRRLGELEAERNRLSGSNVQSNQDEIVRELARNGCGEAYTQEARRRDRSPFSGLWQDRDSGGGTGYGNAYSRLPFATYRTLCVRLCDGYYFPVSFSTLPNHFQRDAQACQSKCQAPAELYYHQNPGAGVDEMVAFSTNEPYTQLKSAFRYRKEYVQGCSCKQSEFIPQTQTPAVQKQGAAEPVPGPQGGDQSTAAAVPQFSPNR